MRSTGRLFSFFMLLAFCIATISSFAQDADQLTVSDLSNAHPHSIRVSPRGHLNGQAHARHGIPNIDSLLNWNDHFFADGLNSDGLFDNHWYINQVGNPPNNHGATIINAPVVPVSIDLLDTDGSVRVVNGHPLHSDVTPFVQPTLNSPVFSTFQYSSSPVPTQYVDAVQRAQFFAKEKSDWHTLLNPSVKTPRTIKIPRGTYQFALNADGSCCRFILVEVNTFVNLLFPAVASDTTTPVGAAENAGEVTTKDMSSFLFPNVFLFSGNVNNCCILGFHTYDFEPGDDSNGNVEKRYVVDYSSWISPGLFGGGFQDVTALSHEIAESFDDPFVASDGIHNVVPWWKSDGQCQNVVENGDVIEGLPVATIPITMNGMTFHPQILPMLQWFERESPSSAIDGTYSYPNEQTLTALSPPQNVDCK